MTTKKQPAQSVTTTSTGRKAGQAVNKAAKKTFTGMKSFFTNLGDFGKAVVGK
jgi:hypothetical protein